MDVLRQLSTLEVAETGIEYRASHGIVEADKFKPTNK
jgi:hypothetical protein